MKFQAAMSLSLLMLAAPAGAQTLKPGLWEVTHKTQMTGTAKGQDPMAQVNQQLAGMTPEQRRQVEAMMAKNGVKMGSAAPGGGMTMKVCMTKEMVERQAFPSQQGDCKTTQQSRSGNTMKMAFACTKPPSSGEGQFTVMSPEAYTMKMAVTSTATGKPEKVDMEGSGKWLGADCGSIKPVSLPKK
jgi:hypothetical protein